MIMLFKNKTFKCLLFVSLFYHNLSSNEISSEWHYLKFENVEIYSHVSKRKTEKIAEDLYSYFEGIQVLMPLLRNQIGARIKIVIAEDYSEFQKFGKKDEISDNTMAVSSNVSSYELIVIRGSKKYETVKFALYYILAKVVLGRLGEYPKWYVDGNAEVFSTFNHLRQKELVFGKNTRYQDSWLKSVQYKSFAPSVGLVMQARNGLTNIPSSDRSLYKIKGYHLCHYFAFHPDIDMRLDFENFARRSNVAGYSEELFGKYLSLTIQEMDDIIRAYTQMPYLNLDYKADFSGLKITKAGMLDLYRTFALLDYKVKNMELMHHHLKQMMEENPDSPITLEIAALYYQEVDEKKFIDFLQKAILAGCGNSNLRLHYAHWLINQHIEKMGHQSLTREKISEVMAHIGPTFQEYRKHTWGMTLFLYVCCEDENIPPASLDSNLSAAFINYPDSIQIMLNLAFIYNRKGYMEELRRVFVRLNQMELNDSQKQSLMRYKSILEKNGVHI